MQLFLLLPAFATADPACATQFETDTDGAKMLTKECCEKAEYPSLSSCLEKAGVKIAGKGPGHNSNSKDKRFYRCAVTLDWKVKERSKWVQDPANLAACAEERKAVRACIESEKKVVINSSPLGFCAGDYGKQQCAMGKTFFCK